MISDEWWFWNVRCWAKNMRNEDLQLSWFDHLPVKGMELMVPVQKDGPPNHWKSSNISSMKGAVLSWYDSKQITMRFYFCYFSSIKFTYLCTFFLQVVVQMLVVVMVNPARDPSKSLLTNAPLKPGRWKAGNLEKSSSTKAPSTHPLSQQGKISIQLVPILIVPGEPGKEFYIIHTGLLEVHVRHRMWSFEKDGSITIDHIDLFTLKTTVFSKFESVLLMRPIGP